MTKVVKKKSTVDLAAVFRMLTGPAKPPKKSRAQEERDAAGTDVAHPVQRRGRVVLSDLVRERIVRNVSLNLKRPGYRKLCVNPGKLRSEIKAQLKREKAAEVPV